ncbi:MAG: type II secretion system minor pseudopilin GspI [Pseudomonadota bacterium]
MTAASRPSRPRESGFTLIEVLVALIVVALAATAVHSQVLQAARNTRMIQLRTLGGWIAQNKVTELRLTEGLPAASRDDGDIEYANRDWVWESEVEPASPDVQNFMRITVEVYLADDRDEIIGSATGFAGQGGNGSLGRPFDTRNPAGGPGTGGDEDDDAGNPRQPITPPGGRITPRGEGT